MFKVFIYFCKTLLLNIPHENQDRERKTQTEVVKLLTTLLEPALDFIYRS